jgi:sulfhydrogenase subunit gamma (sulfur reductase)
MVEVAKNELESLYLPRPALIKKITPMTEMEKMFQLKLDDGSELGHMPGQFVELSLLGIGECPISISSSPTQKGYFELCVRNVGRVTSALHGLKQKDKVGIRGPYGNGFPVEKLKGKDLLFIGGGIGMVPLRSFINYVMDKSKDYGKVTILYGAKTPQEIFPFPEMKDWESGKNECCLNQSVDRCEESDKWTGKVGVITTLIPDLDIDIENTFAIICGPPVMYKFVLLALQGKNFRDDHIYISLERRMKCGVGKCGHCQIHGYYVCQDGPVFHYPLIKGIKEAL